MNAVLHCSIILHLLRHYVACTKMISVCFSSELLKCHPNSNVLVSALTVSEMFDRAQCLIWHNIYHMHCWKEPVEEILTVVTFN